MKIITLFFTMLIGFSFFSCNHHMEDSSENSFSFYSKGYLIPFEVKISVTGNDLQLFYKGADMMDAVDKNYTIKDDEKSSFFGYVNEINFLKMEVPEPEKMRDAPVTTLSADLKGESRTIDIGQMSSVPESLMNLRTRIFNLASAYKPGWKKEAGFE